MTRIYTRTCRFCLRDFEAHHPRLRVCSSPECQEKEKKRLRAEGTRLTRVSRARNKKIKPKKPHPKHGATHQQKDEKDWVDKICLNCGRPYKGPTALNFTRPPGSKPENGTCPDCKRMFSQSHYSEDDLGGVEVGMG